MRFSRKKTPGLIPDAPCMDYLPTLGEKWPHSSGNVGKYSLHGASGLTFHEFSWLVNDGILISWFSVNHPHITG